MTHAIPTGANWCQSEVSSDRAFWIVKQISTSYLQEIKIEPVFKFINCLFSVNLNDIKNELFF